MEKIEKSLSECRKVYSGDVVLPSDVNCLVDTADNMVGLLRDIVRELPIRAQEINPVEFVGRKYGAYHYDKTNVFAWYDDGSWLTGVVLLDGDQGDTVEIKMNFVDNNLCYENNWFGYYMVLSKFGTKFIPVYTTPDTIRIKMRDPALIMIVKNWRRVRTDANVDEFVLVEDAFTVRILKNNEVVKKYDIDVLGMWCGGGACIDWERGDGRVLITPLIPDRWHFVEIGQGDYDGVGKLCLTAYDSTNILDADIIASACEYGMSVTLTFPPSTKLLEFHSISLNNIASGDPYYFSHTILPYPYFKPTRTGVIYC